MNDKFSITYQGENEEWKAIRLPNNQFAVSPPAYKSFEEVKQFIEDLKEYLGL